MDSPLTPLSLIPPGKTVIVEEVHVPAPHDVRLMEMGLLNGTVIELIRYAPLGDPVEIRVRGSHLSLRKHEAEKIWVRCAA